MESKLPGPAVKAGGMRITQDKHQRHETETETPKSLLETGLNKGVELELTATQKEELKEHRLHGKKELNKAHHAQPLPTKEKPHIPQHKPVHEPRFINH